MANRRLVLLLIGCTLLATGLHADDYRQQRQAMVDTTITARGIEHEATLRAMANVPRHAFVEPRHRERAYEDQPIPIGYGQTISQPYIVAYMTALLDLAPGDRVLEIGTGSGYQAAVLAEILDQVFTIEIIPKLADWGRRNLEQSGYHRVEVKTADGYHGWEQHAPFDGIVVTAAAESIPPPLVAQLADGGRMVIPVGSRFQIQMLMLVERHGDDITTRNLLPVRFVPFTRADQH